MKLFEEHPLPWRIRVNDGYPEDLLDANSERVASNCDDGFDIHTLANIVSLLTEGQRKFLGNKEPHN